MDGSGLHMPNEATTVLEGDLEIMKEEVRRSVRSLKMRKAPGIYMWDSARNAKSRW